MNKKGFTLIELLGVIVILGIIATITTPLVQRIIVESKEKAYNDQVSSFEKAAKSYTSSKIFQMKKCTSGCPVSLKTLQEGGFLPTGDIENAVSGETINLSNKVIITYDGETFTYKYDTSQDK